VEGLRRALRTPIGWIAFLLVEAAVLIGIGKLAPASDRRAVLISVAIAMVVGNYAIRRRFLASE
jgi:hypothetical protein